jgi:hypothetical protein
MKSFICILIFFFNCYSNKDKLKDEEFKCLLLTNLYAQNKFLRSDSNNKNREIASEIGLLLFSCINYVDNQEQKSKEWYER